MAQTPHYQAESTLSQTSAQANASYAYAWGGDW